MGFKIIGNRDKKGDFIASADAWPPKKIAELFDKYNPNRNLRLAREAAQKTEEKKEDKAI